MALEIKNENLFKSIVSNAIEAAITNSKQDWMAKRWERAIERAVTEINENPFLHFDSEAKHLVILSSSSNNIYSANGVCQCLAFQNGTPCWHRAAARIWRLYLEAENKPLPPAKAAAVGSAGRGRIEDIPYLKTSNYQLTKIGNIRV